MPQRTKVDMAVSASQCSPPLAQRCLLSTCRRRLLILPEIAWSRQCSDRKPSWPAAFHTATGAVGYCDDMLTAAVWQGEPACQHNQIWNNIPLLLW